MAFTMASKLFTLHLIKIKSKYEPRKERKTSFYISQNMNGNSTFNYLDERKIK